MRRITLCLLLLATTVLIVLPACGGRKVERETTIIRETAPSSLPSDRTVSQPPPAPPEETRGVAPSREHTWVPGYWAWNNGWVWHPGRWELPPQRATAWVPGQWVHTPSGWAWQPGYWQ
jgi:hypothetical protein